MASFYVTDGQGVKKAICFDDLSLDAQAFVKELVQSRQIPAQANNVIVEDSDGNTYVADAIESATFFARELTTIKARSYDVLYAELPWRRIFPISNEADPGAESIIFYTFDKVAMAKMIGNYADDLPLAEIGGKETSIRVKGAGIAWEVTSQELRAATMAGRGISDRKMQAAVRGSEELQNEVAFFGDDTSGLLGLFNNPNVPIGTVPNGVGGNPEWTTKTPTEILFDMFAIVNDIWIDSLMIHTSNRLLLPTDQYKLVNSTARSDVSDTTIAQFFVNNTPFVSMDGMIPLNELLGAGTAGADVMVAYDYNPAMMQYEEVMPLYWHPEQRKNLCLTVPGEFRFAGLNIYYPGSVKIREGI